MANYASLKADVQQYIKQNGNNEITGTILQSILLSMITSLGAGYQFMGVATPSTNPGTPDQNVAYIANGKGTYANFGGIVATDSIGVLKYNGTWTYQGTSIASQGAVLGYVPLSLGKNLYNAARKTSGKYFNTAAGIPTSNANYSISDYIPVVGGTGYHISANGDTVVAGNAYLIWYDSDLNYISGVSMVATKQFTAPDSAAFMRFSLQNSVADVQVEAGTARTDYEAYSPLTNYPVTLPSDVVREGLLNAVAAMKVATAPGKNLYNPNTLTTGKFLNSTGEYSINSNYSVTDYIKVTPGQTIYASTGGNNDPGSSNSYTWFYDASGNPISGQVMGGKVYTVPAGAEYMRMSVRPAISGIQIEVGSARTSYEPYNPLSGYPIASDNELAVGLLKKVTAIPGKNLYDANARTEGRYFNTATTDAANANYAISGYIPVTPGTNIYMSGLGDIVPGGGYMHWFDADLNLLSGVAMTRAVTVPAGAYYLRFSMQKAMTQVQVEVGTARTSYELYNPVAGYPTNIADGSVTMPKLSPAVQALIEGGSSPRFASCRTSGTVAPNGILRTTQQYHVLKNSLLAAKINGSITMVRVGVGKHTDDFRAYYAYWLDIDGTNVRLYWYDNVNDVLLATYAHGLTLTNTTVIQVLTEQNNNTMVATLRMFDDAGNMFTQTLNGWGVGTAFFQNVNTTGSLDVELSFMPRDIDKKIWLFGDSYISFISSNRWPYYMAQQGLLNYFTNSQPGLSPASALADLQSLITLGHLPSFLVWTLGMNGPTTETQSGGEYVINSDQKSVIDSVVSICEDANIPLVLATVPTVPNRQKTGFSNYIRSLGYRYIDFAAAVKCNSAGQWTAGLLSQDEVHPSVAGAKVLASQVLIDFPEIGLAL